MRPFARKLLFTLAPALGAAACGHAAPTGFAPAGGDASDASASGEDAAPGAQGTQGGAAGSGGGSHDAGHPDGAPPVPFSPATHAPYTQVPRNQGQVLASTKLVAVVSPGDPNGSTYFDFVDALASSLWWRSFAAEYGLGTPTTVHVTAAAMPAAQVNSAAMESYIQSAILWTPAAAPDGHTMYMLFLPKGVVILDDSTNQPNTDCRLFGGYHWTYGTGGDAWGVAQPCGGGNSGLTDVQFMTLAASHEIVEAASDPTPGNGWTLPGADPSAPWKQPIWASSIGGEIGDMCAWMQIAEGSFTYQRIWSNAAAAKGGDPCVPAFQTAPYYNVTAPYDWYKVSPGGSVEVPLSAFTDRPAPDWALAAEMYTASAPGVQFAASIVTGTSQHVGSDDYPTINNGRTATLTVTAPQGAASGTWGAIGVYSYPLTPTSQDPYHFWFVGVFVP